MDLENWDAYHPLSFGTIAHHNAAEIIADDINVISGLGATQQASSHGVGRVLISKVNEKSQRVGPSIQVITKDGEAIIKVLGVETRLRQKIADPQFPADIIARVVELLEWPHDDIISLANSEEFDLIQAKK